MDQVAKLARTVQLTVRDARPGSALAREPLAEVLQVIEAIEQDPRAVPLGLAHERACLGEPTPHDCRAVAFRPHRHDARRRVPTPEPFVLHAFRRSNTPASRFFRTSSQGKLRPFIAMYTPGGSACTNESALPRLNSPSELPKAYGTIAPVITTVLPSTSSAIARAVSTIVSVPCVMTICASVHSRHARTINARCSAVISRLSTIISVSTSTSSPHRPRRSISSTCVLRKYNLPVSSSYSLSKVPPVTKTRTVMVG